MNTQVDDGLMLKTTFHKIAAQCYRVLIVLLLLFCYIILVARVGFSGRMGVRLKLVGGRESFEIGKPQELFRSHFSNAYWPVSSVG